MAHHNQSGQQGGGASGTFAALIFILVFAGIVVALISSAMPHEEVEVTVATLVGRNLNWTPSPTVTSTPTATPTATNTPRPTSTPRPSSTPTVTPTYTPTQSGAEAIQASIRSGERLFQSVCSACHGYNAQGVAGLGPSFIGNAFINSQSDSDLLAFIQVGRPATDPSNKSGVSMPARGGANMSDADLVNIIAYIRSLNPDVIVVEGGQLPAVEQPPVVENTEPVEAIEFTPLSLSGLTGRNDEPEEVVNVDVPYTTGAAEIYQFSCAGCHGADGQGVTAAPLSDSALLAEGNGIALFELFTHAPFSTGFTHPYRGGYPELSDQQLLDLIGYLYSLTDE